MVINIVPLDLNSHRDAWMDDSLWPQLDFQILPAETVGNQYLRKTLPTTALNFIFHLWL